MTWGGLILVAVLATQTAPQATLRREAWARGPAIRLGDIAELSAGADARLSALRIASFLGASEQAVLSGPRLAERLRALAPSLTLRGDGDVVVRRLPADPAPATGGESCAVLMRPVAWGVALSSEDIASRPCGRDRAPRPYRYDAAAGAARAVRSLRSGEVIATPPRFAVAAFPTGQALSIETRAGAVHVTRVVEAMRPGVPGRPILVKAEDSHGFAAPFPRSAP